jgi:ABC-2 type transport system permease protein
MNAPMDSPEHTRRPRAATIGAIAARCEWRLVRADAGWWAAVAMVVACVAYAAVSGHARVNQRRQAVADAFRDETERLNALKALLGKIEQGETRPPDAPYRDPRNAIYVGRGQGAAVAHLPDAPLAAAAVGLSDLYPQVLKVSAAGKDTFLFADEIANPVHGLSGTFDMAFVIVYLLPLLVLAVSYDVLSGERERGALALTQATSAPLAAVLAGKLAVRAGGVTAAAVVAFWAFLAFGGAGPLSGHIPALAGLTSAIVLTGAFWAALCLFVNALGRDSAFNAAALVMAWVVLLAVGPAATNAISQAAYPAPARSELVLAVRQTSVDTERDMDAAEARYREEHAETAGTRPPDATARTLEVTVAADARADAILAEQDTRVRSQRRLAERLSLALPPCLIHDAIAELAGAGHTRYDDYLARVAAFHARWRAFFVDKARAGTGLTTADYAVFPRFEASSGSPAAVRESLARIGLSLGLVAAMTTALTLAATRRLARAE